MHDFASKISKVSQGQKYQTLAGGGDASRTVSTSLSQMLCPSNIFPKFTLMASLPEWIVFALNPLVPEIEQLAYLLLYTGCFLSGNYLIFNDIYSVVRKFRNRFGIKFK